MATLRHAQTFKHSDKNNFLQAHVIHGFNTRLRLTFFHHFCFSRVLPGFHSSLSKVSWSITDLIGTMMVSQYLQLLNNVLTFNFNFQDIGLVYLKVSFGIFIGLSKWSSCQMSLVRMPIKSGWQRL